MPGYRESRRLEGDYILTENDIRANRIFDDAVAYGGWPMDEHTRGGIMDFDKLPSRILNFEGNYTIPYRCYYSKNVSNLMMAGRNISTSKMAFGSTRVMGTCAIGGQAAGTAAALAVKYNCTPGNWVSKGLLNCSRPCSRTTASSRDSGTLTKRIWPDRRRSRQQAAPKDAVLRMLSTAYHVPPSQGQMFGNRSPWGKKVKA